MFSNTANVIRVVYRDPPSAQSNPSVLTSSGTIGTPLGYGPYPVSISDCQPVASITEAEDIIFAQTAPAFLSVPTQGKNVGDVLSIQIMRAANNIAACTRRAAGNVVLLHPYNVPLLFSNSFWTSTSGSVGRWTAVLKNAGTATVYTSHHFPKDEVFVAYTSVGASCIDGPGGLLEENGGLFLYITPSTPETFGSSQDFCRRITLV